MVKEKLFKFLFSDKHQRILDLEKEQVALFQETLDQQKRIYALLSNLKKYEEIQKRPKPSLADVMLDELGFPTSDYSNVDERGRPPHYLDNLTPEERKIFVDYLEGVYTNERFQRVMQFVINLLIGNAIVRDKVEDMRNGQMAVLGVKIFRQEFENAHKEFENRPKSGEGFDPLQVLPD